MTNAIENDTPEWRDRPDASEITKARAVRVMARVLRLRFGGEVFKDEPYPDLGEHGSRKLATELLAALSASNLVFCLEYRRPVQPSTEEIKCPISTSPASQP